jgi:hypothetical protein
MDAYGINPRKDETRREEEDSNPWGFKEGNKNEN